MTPICKTHSIWTLPALCVALCVAQSAQAQLYKYTDKDGRTVYSDVAPPTDAKKVEQKRLNKNVIETSGADYEVQQAVKRQPLTLYTTESCAEPCQKARTYLNARGTPFTETVIKSEEQAKPLKTRLGGSLEVPLLDVGGNDLKRGFEEAAWDSILEAAGYPKRTRPGAGQPAAKAQSATFSPANGVDAAR
jgi:glutaredoxin